VSNEDKALNHQIAEIYRKLFISCFKLEQFDNLVTILANSASTWKFIKMIFPETVKPDSEWSQKAKDMFSTVFDNKQYFINPIESLVYNVSFVS
jgi:hypothetical protein